MQCNATIVFGNVVTVFINFFLCVHFFRTESKRGRGFSFMWNNKTAEVKMFGFVDRRAGYGIGCLIRAAYNLHYRVKVALRVVVLYDMGSNLCLHRIKKIYSIFDLMEYSDVLHF